MQMQGILTETGRYFPIQRSIGCTHLVLGLFSKLHSLAGKAGDGPGLSSNGASLSPRLILDEQG